MAMTYKKLAELCGVSRATVDRVMNNRGRVSSELEKHIRAVAEQYKFQPNKVGRALALARNPVKVGVLVHLTQIPFFKTVLEGIYDAQSEISSIGGELIIKEQEGFDAEEQIMLLDEMVSDGVKGIALSPAQDERLSKKLSEISRIGIPIATFNTMVDGFSPICHVGAKNVDGGRLAAYLMDLLLRGRNSKAIIISGYLTQQTNYQRGDGFLSECLKKYPSIEIVGMERNMDDVDRAYEITMQALEKFKDLDAVYMVSSGQEGVCRAIEDSGASGRIQFIAHDLFPITSEYLKKGTIQFILDQSGKTQGKKAVDMLFDYIFTGKPPKQHFIVCPFDIITAYNLPSEDYGVS